MSLRSRSAYRHQISSAATFFELAVVGCLAHPLRLGNVAFDPACPSELAPQFESTPQSPVMGWFALAGVYQPVSLARGECSAPSGKWSLVAVFPSEGR